MENNINFNKLTKQELALLNELEDIKQERIQLSEKYQKALEDAKQEVIDLTTAIEKGEAKKEESYNDFVLGELSPTKFKNIEKQIEDDKEKLLLSENKIKNIAELEKNEVAKQIQSKLEPLKDGLNTMRNRNKSCVKNEIIKAKNIYLDTLKEAKEQLEIVKQYEYLVEEIKITTGQQTVSYLILHDDLEAFFNNGYSNTVGIDISKQEVRKAYNRK